MMNTNIEYEIGKGKVAEYIAAMDKRYEVNLKDIKIYENSLWDYVPELGNNFDYYSALKFVRTWDIIKNELSTPDRNLIVCFLASDSDYTECLTWFNGKDRSIKNVASLRVLICIVRKKIRTIYKERYNE